MIKCFGKNCNEMYLSIVGISMKKNKKGFTLAELLIVVAIIGVLVAIAIPIFTSQLEKSREATDLANVRSAYAQVMVDANLGITDTKITVQLKQKRDYWQSSSNGTVTIGGITHSATETKVQITGMEMPGQMVPVRFLSGKIQGSFLTGKGETDLTNII